VVSKDNDFLESLLISEKPYKLLLVNTGNITNRQLMGIFENHLDLIIQSLESNRLVEIMEEKLIVHGWDRSSTPGDIIPKFHSLYPDDTRFVSDGIPVTRPDTYCETYEA